LDASSDTYLTYCTLWLVKYMRLVVASYARCSGMPVWLTPAMLYELDAAVLPLPTSVYTYPA